VLTVNGIQIIRVNTDLPTVFSSPVDFIIPGPGIYLLEGDNQAGKSALIKTLMGVYSAGNREPLSANIDGVEITIASPHDAIANHLAAVFQDDHLIPSLTVLEQYKLLFASPPLLNLFCKSVRRDSDVVRDAINLISDYGRVYHEVLEKKPGELSGGALAVARLVKAQLQPNVKVLFLDEAFNAVQRDVWPELVDRLREWQSKEPRAIVVVSHNDEEKLRWNPTGSFRIADRRIIYSSSSQTGLGTANN
jgi:ABC-type sugar transport system ATPase subunit